MKLLYDVENGKWYNEHGESFGNGEPCIPYGNCERVEIQLYSKVSGVNSEDPKIATDWVKFCEFSGGGYGAFLSADNNYKMWIKGKLHAGIISGTHGSFARFTGENGKSYSRDESSDEGKGYSWKQEGGACVYTNGNTPGAGDAVYSDTALLTEVTHVVEYFDEVPAYLNVATSENVDESGTSGTLYLYSGDDVGDSVEYTSRTGIPGGICFKLKNGTVISHDYTQNAQADIPEMLYMQAEMDSETSDPSSGFFAFNVVCDSVKLRNKMKYESRKTVSDIVALELAIFRIEEGTPKRTVTVKRFYNTGFSISGGIADTNSPIKLPDLQKNALVMLMKTMFAKGYETQLSVDGIIWVNYADVENFLLQKWFRLRQKDCGGEWTNGIPLPQGVPGLSAFEVYKKIEGNSAKTETEFFDSLKLKFAELTPEEKATLVLTYDALTPEQKANLTLTFDKLTTEQKNSLKLKFADLTDADKLTLKGEPGTGLNPRGAYDPAATYAKTNALADVVEADGSLWMYINATPSAGNAPPVSPIKSNVYWTLAVGRGTQGLKGDVGTSAFAIYQAQPGNEAKTEAEFVDSLKLKFADLTDADKAGLKLKFTDLTDVDKAALSLTWDKLTVEQKATLALTWDKLTVEQKADLTLTFDKLTVEQKNSLKLKFADLTPEEKVTLALTFDKLTTEQKNSLKLKFADLTDADKLTLKGEPGTGLNPRGAYDPAATYAKTNALADVVESDGSLWLYINATPSAGNAPPVSPLKSNAYWTLAVGRGTQGLKGDVGTSALAIYQAQPGNEAKTEAEFVDSLKLKFADLTDADKTGLKLKFTDLTDVDKAALSLTWDKLTVEQKATLALTWDKLTVEQKANLTLTFDKLTVEQKNSLKLKFADLTLEEKATLVFTWDKLTVEQKADLTLTFDKLTVEQKNSLKLKFADLTPEEKATLALTFDKLTTEQKNSLKLKFADLTDADKLTLKGEPGTGLNPRGAYDPAATYSKANALADVVESDGSLWMYINATPSAGNAPPAAPLKSNAYWTLAVSNTHGYWRMGLALKDWYTNVYTYCEDNADGSKGRYIAFVLLDEDRPAVAADFKDAVWMEFRTDFRKTGVSYAIDANGTDAKISQETEYHVYRKEYNVFLNYDGTPDSSIDLTGWMKFAFTPEEGALGGVPVIVKEVDTSLNSLKARVVDVKNKVFKSTLNELFYNFDAPIEGDIYHAALLYEDGTLVELGEVDLSKPCGGIKTDFYQPSGNALYLLGGKLFSYYSGQSYQIGTRTDWQKIANVDSGGFGIAGGQLMRIDNTASATPSATIIDPDSSCKYTDLSASGLFAIKASSLYRTNAPIPVLVDHTRGYAAITGHAASGGDTGQNALALTTTGDIVKIAYNNNGYYVTAMPDSAGTTMITGSWGGDYPMECWGYAIRNGNLYKISSSENSPILIDSSGKWTHICGCNKENRMMAVGINGGVLCALNAGGVTALPLTGVTCASGSFTGSHKCVPAIVDGKLYLCASDGTYTQIGTRNTWVKTHNWACEARFALAVYALIDRPPRPKFRVPKVGDRGLAIGKFYMSVEPVVELGAITAVANNGNITAKTTDGVTSTGLASSWTVPGA